MDALIFPLALVAFPLVWSAVCVIISRTGWARLAVTYATDLSATGTRFSGVSGGVGLASYNGVLQVSIEPQGLRLSVMVLFRPGHPPILIPWDDVLDIERKTVLWHTSYALHTAAGVTIRLPGRVVDAIPGAAAAE